MQTIVNLVRSIVEWPSERLIDVMDGADDVWDPLLDEDT